MNISNLDLKILKEKYPYTIDEVLKKMEDGYPVQYLIGDVDFYGLTFKVDKRALIPRFETETLVDKTINYINKYFNRRVDIIDLGTGTGCIAITLKKKIDSNVDAMDISKDALTLAKENALLNDAKIIFINKSMEEALEKKYDVIISNPPYIKEDGFVEDIVKNNEPHIALFAKDEGIYFYKVIIQKHLKNLNKPGIMAFEIGDNEEKLLKEFLSNYNLKYSFEKDLQGLTRYLFIFNE